MIIVPMAGHHKTNVYRRVDANIVEVVKDG
jgi:hypothetical protein